MEIANEPSIRIEGAFMGFTEERDFDPEQLRRFRDLAGRVRDEDGVELGPEPMAAVGDVATLLGPDRPDIHPNEVSERTGRSVYDVVMHLSPGLPKRAWGGAEG